MMAFVFLVPYPKRLYTCTDKALPLRLKHANIFEIFYFTGISEAKFSDLSDKCSLIQHSWRER